ncbi:unnamed protein product, partial [Prorocentrum cordatum]
WRQLELDSACLRAALTLALCAASSGLATLLILNPPAPQANLPCIWKAPEVRFLCSLQAASPAITSSCVPIGGRQCLCMNAVPILAPPDSSQVEFYAAAVITQALDGVDLQATLRQRVATMRSAPAFLRGPLRNALRKALREIHALGGNEARQLRGWKLLFLIPRMLLSKGPGARTVPKEQLLERFARFEAGDWAPLLAPPARRRSGGGRGRPLAGSDEELSQRCARAHALVHQGEVSAARQALTASALAPGTEATLAELRGPARRLAQPREPLRGDLAALAPEPILLESDKLLRNLRGCRRGAAPGEHLFAFLDDIYVVPAPARSRDVFELVHCALQRHCGIGVNMGKTKVWNAAGTEPPRVWELGTEQDRVWVGDTAAPPHEQGLVVLGTPIGHVECVRHHMRSMLADHRVLLHRLCQVGDLQTAWLLLSMCANPRANFHLRTMAPEDTLEFATAHDEYMAAAVTDLLGNPADQLAAGQTAREVAQLPLCLGGLGLRCAARMAPAAWWASWADCLPMLRERAPALTADICWALDTGAAGLPPGLRQAAEARRQLALEGYETPNWTALALGARPPPTHDREMGEWAHGWQFWAARARDDRARVGIMQRMQAPERALLRSQSGPCAGRVFTVLPTSEPMRVPPAELRVLLLRLLRLDLPFTAGACRCRARLDSRGDHRAACPTAGVLKKRGAPLEKAAARICREAGARVAENQFLRDLNVDGVGAGDGPRLEVIANGLPLWGGAQLAVDATLVCPLGRDGAAHPRTADEDGAWIREARRRKETTYPELLDARRCRLVVMALEVGGRWSQEALQFVRLLADCKAWSAPELLRASVKAAWIQRWTGLASVAAQRAFAASLLHLPLDGLACDGDEPWLQDVLADARHAEAPLPSRMPARP